MTAATGDPPTRADPYLAYTRRFFRQWVPVYDLFAAPIAPVYRAALGLLSPEPHRKVIDICCGTGEMALRCARRGASVTGVDITPEMLQRARRKARKLSLRFLEVDARRLPFPDDSFDFALLALALHDMPRRVRLQVLAEAERVAFDRLLILDYHFPRAPLLRRPLIAAVGLFETAYFRRFAQEGLAGLLREAGMEDRISSHLRWPLLAAHTIDLRQPRKVDAS